MCVLGVHGNLIPWNPLEVAAFRLRLTCVRLNLVPQLLREEVVFIPVLLNSWVRKTCQNGRARTGIVRWQNRFPHRKNMDVRIGISR